MDSEYPITGLTGALESRPDIAAAFGVFSAAFNTLDFVPVIILACIIGDDQVDRSLAYAILSHFNSLDQKLKVVDSCLGESTLSEARTSEFKKVIRKSQEVRAFRNKLVHGYWRVEGPKVVVSFRSKDEEISVERLTDSTHWIRKILGKCAAAADVAMEEF